MSKSDYLQEVLETYRMSHIDTLRKKYLKKRDEVKEALEKQYTSTMYNPINSGSYAKHTMINNKFDVDIVVPFKRNAFATLEAMFEAVFDFLTKEYRGKAYVKKQNVSIGIEFNPDSNGDIVHLDIVPGRELNVDQYLNDKKLNLQVHGTFNSPKESDYVQTNIQKQINYIKGKDSERQIIRLLKIWKSTNHEKYKSFLIELLTIKAFDNMPISSLNLWGKLNAVMEYIRDHIAEDNFTLKDPGNSGNDVVRSLESRKRQNLSSKMKTMLENINGNTDTLKTYFPVNKNFHDDSSSGYGVKIGGSAFSKPKDDQRFG